MSEATKGLTPALSGAIKISGLLACTRVAAERMGLFRGSGAGMLEPVTVPPVSGSLLAPFLGTDAIGDGTGVGTGVGTVLGTVAGPGTVKLTGLGPVGIGKGLLTLASKTSKTE